MDIDYKTIGNRIREYRKKAGMTQETLAEISGIEPSNISHIERAATKVSLPTLISIANALNASLDELVYGNLVKSKHISVKVIDEAIAGLSPDELTVVAAFLKNSIDSFKEFKRSEE